MSATTQLKNLLDKHGIKWRSKHGKKTMWKVINPDNGKETKFKAWECSDGSLTVSIEDEYNYSPELVVCRTLFIASNIS
jgi:hypothetical protein